MHTKTLLAVLAALTSLSIAQLVDESGQMASGPEQVIPEPAIHSTGRTQLFQEPQAAKVIDNMRCGKGFKNKGCPDNLCCSHEGWCGSTSDHCRVPENCQEDFGRCDSTDPNNLPQGANVSIGDRKYNDKFNFIITECTKPKTFALSFDDGPHPGFTDTVLDVLKAHNARATFFLGGVLNGRGTIDHNFAPSVRRMVEEGHQVGSHTWSHLDLTTLGPAERKLEMYKNERAIANAIGKMPTFMRAPKLRCSEHAGCREDMKALGYHIVHWQYDSEDWRASRPSVAQTVARLQEKMNSLPEDGNMFIIQHDFHESASDVTHALLQNLKPGWQAVPLVECLDQSLDQAYRFPHYLEYDGAAKGGCLVSGPNFCITPEKFQNRDECKHAYEGVLTAVHNCSISGLKTLTKPAGAHCDQARKLAVDMHEFCLTCIENGKVGANVSGGPACHWKSFQTKKH